VKFTRCPRSGRISRFHVFVHSRPSLSIPPAVLDNFPMRFLRLEPPLFSGAWPNYLTHLSLPLLFHAFIVHSQNSPSSHRLVSDCENIVPPHIVTFPRYCDENFRNGIWRLQSHLSSSVRLISWKVPYNSCYTKVESLHPLGKLQALKFISLDTNCAKRLRASVLSICSSVC